jgi:hypothetical protein
LRNFLVFYEPIPKGIGPYLLKGLKVEQTSKQKKKMYFFRSGKAGMVNFFYNFAGV